LPIGILCTCNHRQRSELRECEADEIK